MKPIWNVGTISEKKIFKFTVNINGLYVVYKINFLLWRCELQENDKHIYTTHVSYVLMYVNQYTTFHSTASHSPKCEHLLSHWALYFIVGIKDIVFKVSSLALASDYENRSRIIYENY